MSAGDGRQAANDSEIIADFRRTYEQLVKAGAPANAAGKPWSMRLTLEEMGALLRAVDERDELRRQGVGDWEPELPPVTVATVREKSPLIAQAEAALEPIADVVDRIVEKHGGVIGVPAHWVDAEPKPFTTCPHAGTHHSCPLGGCPTFERREVPIPDLPADEDEEPWSLKCSVVSPSEWAGEFTRCVLNAGHEGAHFDGAFPWEDRPIGREGRETPPRACPAMSHPDSPGGALWCELPLGHTGETHSRNGWSWDSSRPTS